MHILIKIKESLKNRSVHLEFKHDQGNVTMFPHPRKMISTHLILMQNTHILIHTHTHLNRLALMDAQQQDESSRRVTDFKAVLNERIFFTGAVIHSYLSSITPVPSVHPSAVLILSAVKKICSIESLHFCNLKRCIEKQKCLFIPMESEHIWYGEL